MNNGYAVLSSRGEYTTFSFGDRTITFLTGKNLDRYTEVVQWDNGYLVVMAEYKTGDKEEEYIDLVPILQNLYMDAEKFLDPIRGVDIRYV